MIIWISLAAVVVVIIIICLLALRFLRADDTDAFEALPDEPRRPARAQDDPRLREHASPAGARRPADDRSAAYRDRGPDRHTGPERRISQGSGSQGRPVQAGARPARPSRPAAAADSSHWDSLSDVDYWAELSADKPFTASGTASATASPAAAATGGRRGIDPATSPRPVTRTDPGPNLPVRQRPASRPARSGRNSDFAPSQAAGPRSAQAPVAARHGNGAAEPATESLAALARLGNQAPVSQPQHFSQPRSAVRQSPPVPLDDDPLTSPSFPAINTSDSRSYRSRGAHTQPGASRQAPRYEEPTQQVSSYDRAPVSPPTGYPVQQPAVPAGNPYGSFVSQPTPSYQQQAPAASHLGSSYGGYSNGSQATSPDLGWYGAPVHGANGQGQPGQTSENYQPGYYQGYQVPQPENTAYAQQAHQASQHDQRGYSSQEAGYGRDGYQGYTGYGSGGY